MATSLAGVAFFVYFCRQYGKRTICNERTAAYQPEGATPLQGDHLQRRLHHDGVCREDPESGILQV